MTTTSELSAMLQTGSEGEARSVAGNPATLLMYDTSNPRGLNIGAQVAAGYLGPAGNTPHIWTALDWAAQTARWRLPIWVPANPANAQAEAAAFAAALEALRVPKGSTCALDLETHQWAGDVATFAALLRLAGYETISYGSASTIFGNPVESGYWVADWTGQPHLYPHPGTVATQYNHDQVLANGVPVDQSLIVSAVPLWDTRPPAPPSNPREMFQAARVHLHEASALMDALIPLLWPNG